MAANLSHADMIVDATAVVANEAILNALLTSTPTVAAGGATSTHLATVDTGGGDKDYSLVVTYDTNGNATGVVITNVSDTQALAGATIDPAAQLTYEVLMGDSDYLTQNKAILDALYDATPVPNGDGSVSTYNADVNGLNYTLAITYSDGTADGLAQNVEVTAVPQGGSPYVIASSGDISGQTIKPAMMVGPTPEVAANKTILEALLAEASDVANDGSTSTHLATADTGGGNKDYSLVVSYDANGDATGVVIKNVTDNQVLSDVSLVGQSLLQIDDLYSPVLVGTKVANSSHYIEILDDVGDVTKISVYKADGTLIAETTSDPAVTLNDIVTAVPNLASDPVLFSSSEMVINTSYAWAGATDADATNDVIEQFEASNNFDPSKIDGGLNSWVNTLTSNYIFYDDPIIVSSGNYTNVAFDHALLADLTQYSDFTTAVDAILSGWSTDSASSLRVVVDGTNLYDWGDSEWLLETENTINSIKIQAVKVSGGTETVADLYTLDGAGQSWASLSGVAFVPVVSGGSVFESASDAVKANALAYINEQGIVTSLAADEASYPATVKVDHRNMTIDLIDTKVSENAEAGAIVPDSLSNDIRMSVDLGNISWIDTSPVATKDTVDDLWYGVNVKSENYIMKMAFTDMVDKTIETLTDQNTPIVSDIYIYQNIGTFGSPVQGQEVGKAQNVQIAYYDYVKEFESLDATNSSTSNGTGNQGTLFAGLGDTLTDGIAVIDIVADFLYEDQGFADTVTVEEVRLYTGDTAANQQTLITLNSSDTLDFNEIYTYLEATMI